MAHEQEFHPDRFTQLHNSLHQVFVDLFGQHRDRLEEKLERLERIIMTGFAEVETEVAKVKAAVVDLKTQLAALSTGGGATSAQLDQVITDLEAALAAPATPPASDPGTGTGDGGATQTPQS